MSAGIMIDTSFHTEEHRVQAFTFPLPPKHPPIFACGSHLKNTVCAIRGNQIRISPVHENLEEETSFDAFRGAITLLEKWLGSPPEFVAHDLHPDYISTKVASQLAAIRPGAEMIGVQHHHAHIAGCMAEYGLEGPVVGVALDGTGYGLDGNIWGGEILIAELHTFRREGWLQPFALPGGVRAIREPWRVGLSLCHQTFGRNTYDLDIGIISRREKEKLEFLIAMVEQGINAPYASSCGRLFDAVAAILGVREYVQHEGEAAIALEQLVEGEWSPDEPRYAFALNRRKDGLIIDPAPMVKALVHDCHEHVDVDLCSLKFHNGLIDAYATAVAAIAKEMNIHTIAFGGGCFRNSYLCSGLRSQLEARGFSVFVPHLVPVGDAGISFGQAVVAASILARRMRVTTRNFEERQACFPT